VIEVVSYQVGACEPETEVALEPRACPGRAGAVRERRGRRSEARDLHWDNPKASPRGPHRPRLWKKDAVARLPPSIGAACASPLRASASEHQQDAAVDGSTR